jgi:hypothetical protein
MVSDVDPHAGCTDPLVLNIQLIYDGYIPHWACVNDTHEDTSQWLCKICSWGRWLGNFGKPNDSQPLSLRFGVQASLKELVICHGYGLMKRESFYLWISLWTEHINKGH